MSIGSEHLPAGAYPEEDVKINNIRLLWNALENTITDRYCSIMQQEENVMGENTTNSTKFLIRGNFTAQQR